MMTTTAISKSQDTHSHAAALRELCMQWALGLEKCPTPSVLKDVEKMLSELESFRASVRQALPIDLGGFGGLKRDQAIKLLANAKVEVYETEGGYFGFTGCETDQWEHFDDAINAALQAHPEAQFVPLPLTVKGEVCAS